MRSSLSETINNVIVTFFLQRDEESSKVQIEDLPNKIPEDIVEFHEIAHSGEL